MRYADSFLDEIRSRLSASDVVGRRVRLKKQGREYAGLSPFNQEKTPSFFVNDDKQRWFDFSAGKSGDIFTFLMETEGLSFPEAVERLAGEAGVPMPARDPEAEARERQRAGLTDVMDLAAVFFEERLQSADGAHARGYLQRRGITPELQRKFRIGYAPNSRNALKEHLAAKGIGLDQMIAAGLLISGEDIPVAYDRFRNRVMFPIADMRDRVVAFGGRALDPDAKAKYLNSPETELFHKGALLYNGAMARRAAHDAGTVIVVEGYADVVQMSAAGFDNTVAPLGTALTDRQLDLLWKMASEPVLCFDGDKAGRRAAFKALDTALPRVEPGRSLRFALLPGGQDPDDLIRAEGAGAMEAVLAAATPMVDLLWTRETEEETFDTPERRASLERRLGEIVRAIGDETVRRHYSEALRERLSSFFHYRPQETRAREGRPEGRRTSRGGPWQREPQRAERPPISQRLLNTAVLRERQAYPLREAVLIMIAVSHPELAADDLDGFGEIEFSHRDLDAVRAAILDLVSEDAGIDAAALRRALGAGPMAGTVEMLAQQVAANRCWPARPEAAHADAAAVWHQALVLHRRNRALNRELRDAEAALARDPSDLNLARLVDIQKQLASQDGIEALIEGFGVDSGRSAVQF